ncbi:unnamed protein product [Rhizoctonia solani]|uniref:beta-glucosidase n=1 Tax=Rhizoctonia solani TaxID=456999 RepID=A0A8H3CKC5_9AGAM|nr:unnamed protein product [Rhizoctonia solani]
MLEWRGDQKQRRNKHRCLVRTIQLALSSDTHFPTSPRLHEPIFKISFMVKHTEKVAGSEVAQLYLTPPASLDEPPSVLRGFSKVQLDSGKSKQVDLILSRYDLSIWGVTRQGSAKVNNSVGVWVGGSSRDVNIESIPVYDHIVSN